MLRNISVFLLICFLKQNNAFVIPLDAEIAGFEAESSVSDHQLEKKSPQSYFPDFPFEPTSTTNDEQSPFPANLPQFGMQFATNGLQTDLSTGFVDVPFQSGNMIDPGGRAFRDLGQEMFNQPLPPNGVVTGSMASMNQNGNQPPAFRTESFNITPDGQQLYENGKLVENLPNQGPTSTTQGTAQTPITPQNSAVQGQSGNLPQPNVSNVQQAVTGSTPLNQIPSNPNFAAKAQQPTDPGLQQGQLPGGQNQSNPAIKVSSVGASSSTFVSSTNNQPPEMSQTAGAYNYNYDSNRPDPVSGGYVMVNGNTPNMNDPTQGNYQYAHGSFPNQQNTGVHSPNLPGYQNYQPALNRFLNQPEYQNLPQTLNTPNMNDLTQGNYQYAHGSFPNQQNTGVHSPNPLNPSHSGYQNHQQALVNQLPNQPEYQNFPQTLNQKPMFYPSNTNYKQGWPQMPNAGHQNQQTPHQPLLNGNRNNYLPQGHSSQPGVQYNNGHLSMIPHQINTHMGRLNDHLTSIGLPNLNPSAVVAPFTELMQTMPNMIRNAANQGLIMGKIPLDVSNAALERLTKDLGEVSIREMVQIPAEFGKAVISSIEEMINQFQRTLIPTQQVQQQALARRSVEPWTNQFYNTIPYSSAQDTINNWKNDILNRMPTSMIPSIDQINPFKYFNKPQMPQIPQMPQFPQPSANGEPVVKVYSSSVSESTQSSSKNGAPPEVSHQAAGYKYDYDSTKDDPVQSDIVALKGYTPDASDPDQGTFVAYENSYP